MKTARLTVEVEYDESKTDPQGLSRAMDILMETALSTPDLLDDYGNPHVGAFLPENKARMALAEIYEMLYLDESGWNDDKEWDSETIEHVAHIIRDVMPHPHNLSEGDDVGEMIK